MGKADSHEAFFEAIAEYQGTPWVNTLTPGLTPFASTAQQTRSDYVFNANSSHWLLNLDEPLEGFSILFGPERTVRSTRTRYNAQLITDTSRSGLAGSDGLFSFKELRRVMTHNGPLFGGEWKNLLTQRCINCPEITYQNANIDLTPACQALINRDGTYNPGRMGAHLMREFLLEFRVPVHRAVADSLFGTAFDAYAPAATPAGLAPINSDEPNQNPVLQALAAAVVKTVE